MWRLAGSPLSRRSANAPIRRLCERHAPTVVLLDAKEASKLSPLEARSLTVRVDHNDQHVKLLDIFVLRDAGGEMRAYENHCPHAGGPLNLIPDRYFMRNSPFLMCTRHAALFASDNGICIKGPCAGESLRALPIVASPETGVQIDSNTLCEAVQDAYMICRADSDEAAGPVVQRPKAPELRRRPPRRSPQATAISKDP